MSVRATCTRQQAVSTVQMAREVAELPSEAINHHCFRKVFLPEVDGRGEKYPYCSSELGLG